MRIYRQLQRFAEYEDLKDLYNRVIPEIAKFEVKIIDFESFINDSKLIIRQFDEVMTNKCDKIML